MQTRNSTTPITTTIKSLCPAHSLPLRPVPNLVDPPDRNFFPIA